MIRTMTERVADMAATDQLWGHQLDVLALDPPALRADLRSLEAVADVARRSRRRVVKSAEAPPSVQQEPSGPSLGSADGPSVTALERSMSASRPPGPGVPGL
jgi:hypothetical protein